MQLRHLALAAVSTTALASVLAAGPVAAAEPAVIAPGVTIYQSTDAETARCTVAFAGTWDGKRVAVTAGHCNLESSRPVLDENKQKIGTYTASLREDPDKLQADATGFGMIVLDANVRTDAHTKWGNLTGFRTAAQGETACLLGSVSGRTCGKITAASTKAVSLDFEVKPGDSGGPLIEYLDDGKKDATGRPTSFAIVGIVMGQHNKTDGIASPIDNTFNAIVQNGLPGLTMTTVTS